MVTFTKQKGTDRLRDAYDEGKVVLEETCHKIYHRVLTKQRFKLKLPLNPDGLCNFWINWAKSWEIIKI